MKSLDVGLDCSSYCELLLAKELGFYGEHIFFTSNNTTVEEYKLAFALGAIINIDSLEHVDLLNDLDLIRPGMYGSYHHITNMCAHNRGEEVVDVVGSLCENNDKFAIDRKLPKSEIGYFLVLHDAGAHCHPMGFNYNGRLRSAEFLLSKTGEFQKIRRRETPQDYFETVVDFDFGDVAKD